MEGRRGWILRAIVESVLIVASIILALAVDEWRENRQNEELATQSLAIFEREIRQNLARVQDAAPYHAGLRDVVARMATRDASSADLRSVMEGLQPTVLLNTAWETALATGALTHMHFEVVSALSLTYGLQERFTQESRSDLPRVSASPGMSPGLVGDQIAQAQSYLTSLARNEQELQSVYRQALEVIRARTGGAQGPDPADLAHP